jgi:hypothetical protein
MTAHVLRCGDFVRLGACWFNRNHVTGIGRPIFYQVRVSPADTTGPERSFTRIEVRNDGAGVSLCVRGTEADGVEAHRQFVYEVIGHLEPAP